MICLNGAKSVRRILAPAENAYDKYNEILESIKKEANDSLVLLALGPTATVLAYDLSMAGYQALDLGHFDIEYEWFLLQTDSKVKIENKYVNEVTSGNITSDVENDEYKSQIIKIIKGE